MTDNTTRLIQLKTNLTKIFNILNTDMVYSGEYHFVLFLLTLQKEGLLDRVFPEEVGNLYQEIRHNIIVSKSKNTEIYVRIGEHFEIVLRTLKPVTLVQILNLFRNLDAYTLQENFSDIFDDLLYKLIKYRSRSSGEQILPFEISQFVSNLVELPDNAKIYNPFAGLASFGVFTNENHEYLGQEVNYNTWILGQLRLIAYNRGDNSKLLFESSVEKWNPKRKYSSIKKPLEEEKYDLIIANPPFNARIPPRRDIIKSRFFGAENCERFLIEKGLEDLTSNGKLIAIVSHGLLFRGASEQELRRYLIGSDFLEMVISFPDGLLFNTGIPIAVLVISKDKKDRGVVKFIDAKSTVETASSKEKRINVAALNKIVKEDVPSEYKRVVSNETIARFDYNLNVPLYFQREIHGVIFEKLVNSISPQRNYEDTHGKFVRVRDLKEDKLEYVLDLEKIEKTELPRNVQKISESCLLVASRGKMLKPTFFEFLGEAVFITPDIIALKVNESEVDIAYLVNEFYADYITEQADAYRVGGTIPILRKGDLLNVKIILPNSREQQVAKMTGVKEAYIASRKIQLQLEQELLGLEDSASRELASMKHTLRQYLSALKSNVLGTKKFISNNEGLPIKLDTVYSKNLSQTFEEHLNSIEGTIDSMSKVLSSLDEKSNDFDNSRNQNLYTLVVNAHHRFAQHAIFEFQEVYLDKDSFELEDPIINISEQDFYKLFSNIVSNAINHGFKNSTKRNIMRISLSYNPSLRSCELEISNNGRPIPKQFTLKHLTTRGEKTTDSSGSGIGGADIKAIVEKHNGYFDLATDEENDFPVTYILGFPLLIPNEDAI